MVIVQAFWPQYMYCGHSTLYYDHKKCIMAIIHAIHGHSTCPMAWIYNYGASTFNNCHSTCIIIMFVLRLQYRYYGHHTCTTAIYVYSTSLDGHSLCIMDIVHVLWLSYTYYGQSTCTTTVMHVIRSHYIYYGYRHVLIVIIRGSHQEEHVPRARRSWTSSSQRLSLSMY